MMGELHQALNSYTQTIGRLLDEELKAVSQNTEKPNLGKQIELDSEQDHTRLVERAHESPVLVRVNDSSTINDVDLPSPEPASTSTKTTRNRIKADSKTVNPLKVMGRVIVLATFGYVIFFFFL